MKTMIISTAAAIAILCCSGCRSLTGDAQANLSQSETQARTNKQAVDLAAIQAGQIQKLLSSATQNIDKGFRFQDSGKEVARDIDGSPLFVDVPTANGIVKAPLYVDWSTELSLNSYVDLTKGVEGLELQVGQLSVLQDNTNQIYRSTPNRNGLSIKINKAGGSSTNADALSALKAGQALNKTASGDAVAKAIKVDWDGRIEFLGNGVVKVVDSIGKEIVGRLIELSPYGAASGLVQAVIETDDGPVTKIIPKPKP